MIPDFVFFNNNQYELFLKGGLAEGDKICVGFNSCEQPILTIKKVNNLDMTYVTESNMGGATHVINWDLDVFNKELFRKYGARWAFYRLILKRNGEQKEN